ncbi:hypothetical protein KAR91_64060 [Candidatus Pacearchaeota archaeon]|nr:hypothetical protein [Candidatus Pacearchaeota archaeon]
MILLLIEGNTHEFPEDPTEEKGFKIALYEKYLPKTGITEVIDGVITADYQLQDLFNDPKKQCPGCHRMEIFTGKYCYGCSALKGD